MNSVCDKFRVVLLAGAVALGSISAPLFAVEDVLETPALESAMASETLLLDIAKAGKRLVAVGSRGHIVLSDDNGVTWRQAKVPVSVLLTAVSFADEKNGWAVGHGGVILHSSDAGANWQKQFDGNQANKSIVSQTEETIVNLQNRLSSASEESMDDLELQLEQAQYMLDDANQDAEVGASKPFLDVLFSNKNEGFAVGAYGFIFKTEDGGKQWKNYVQRIPNPDRFHLNTITELAGGTLLIGGEAGVMFKSEDRGETWAAVDSPYDGSFFGVLGTGEPDVAIAFGLRGHLFRSEDAGQTWTAVESTTESTLMAGSYDGAGKISIVGNSGSILLSKDGGRTFSETIRENRLGNVSVVYVDKERMVIVGENGVNLTDPAGQNL